MSDRLFWSRAANYGLLLGGAVFAVSLLSWALRLDGRTWIPETMLFAVLCVGIFITGRCNAASADGGGYTFGRSVGFVFALMLFTGIAAGAGDFILRAFIAPEYYREQMRLAFDTIAPAVPDAQTLDMARRISESLLTNPVFLIFSEIINLGVKGGFLGIVMSVFLKKEPSEQKNVLDDER